MSTRTAKRPTRPSTPRLSEAARHVVIPDGIVTTGWPRVKRQLADMGVVFDPWQEGVCTVALGKDEHGKYAATVGGVTLSIPRQVGKTFMVGALLIAMCIVFPGLKVVWTAHHLRTSTNTFRALQSLVKRKRVVQHLASDGRSDGIRTANGEQEIRFRNGSIIMFGARAQGFGRGFEEVDVEVFDEAQILTEKALEDMLAATNQAQHEHGALLFFMGTPPRPTDPGEAFTNKRARALAGKLTNGVYIECSADPECATNAALLDDHDQWLVANASYPTRTPHESMLRLRENLPSDDSWRREGLGVWDEFNDTKTDIFGPGKWLACLSEADMPDEPAAIGVAVSVDRLHASIAAAVVVEAAPDDDPEGEPVERIFVAPVRRDDGVAWTVDEAKRIQDKYDCAVVIDEKGPTKDSIKDLEDGDVALECYSLDQYAEACSRFFDRVQTGAVVHPGAAELDEAVAGAVWRTVGDRQVWGRRKSESDVSMLEAATLAAHAAELVGAFNIY